VRSAAADDAAVIESSWREPERFAVLFDRHAPRYDLSYCDARPWLYGIATNLAGQHRRDEARRFRIRQAAVADPDVPGHAERVAADVTAQAMHTLLGRAAAGRFAAAPEVTTSRPVPSVGQPAELRSPAPPPVLTAVRLMYGGAIGTAVQLIAALAFIGDINAYHLTVLGHHLTNAQLSHWRPLIITLAVVFALVVIGLWLWMARTVGQGRNWARIACTVLAGLATLELTGTHGVAQVLLALLTWLTGLAAVWQLWRPASSAFFRRHRQAVTRRP
jgi:hypothetical protein